jgi:2-dehydro-3-deoxygluconokinase
LTAEIVGLGEPLFELSQRPDGLFLPGFGGDTSNVVIAAARLGVRAAYITRLGRDAPGDALLQLWGEEGLDISAVARDERAPTGLYLVTHGPKGHQFSYYRTGSAASYLTPDDVPEGVVSGAKFLHVSAISQAISASAEQTVAHAIDIAEKLEVAVSYDTNFRLRLWPIDRARQVICATAKKATILKTAADEAEVLTGVIQPSEIAELFHGLGCKIVVVTRGSDGVLVSSNEGQFDVAGHRIDCVDATGAGDALTGAFLASLCKGQNLQEAAHFANAAAALSTRGYGAVAPLPRQRDVEMFLRETPRLGAF